MEGRTPGALSRHYWLPTEGGLAEPLAGFGGLCGLAWGQALDRTLLGVKGDRPPHPSLHTPGPKNCLSAPPTATSREDLPPFPRSHCRTVYPRDSRGGGTNAGLSVPTGLSVFTNQTQTVTQASGQRGAPPASPLWFSWVCRRVSESSL